MPPTTTTMSVVPIEGEWRTRFGTGSPTPARALGFLDFPETVAPFRGTGQFKREWEGGSSTLIFLVIIAIAQGENTKVNDNAGWARQRSASIVMDGNGNFVIVWEDGRNGNSDIYYQRYNNSGEVQGVNTKANDDAGEKAQCFPMIEMDNSGRLLKPDMFVTGSLVKSKGKGTQLTVPKTATLWTGQRSVVYLKKQNTVVPSFEYREVVLGQTIGNNYVVLEGLEDGEEVVTNGAFVIDAAAQLNNRVSMMNRNVMAKGEDHTDHVPDYSDVTPTAFKEQLIALTSAYFKVKDALVASDIKLTGSQAANLIKKTNEVDMSWLSGDAHVFWMQQQGAILAHAQNIQKAMDLEAQRAQFEYLSAAVIRSVKSLGVPSGTLFVQHCPMVNNNHGADWLSDTEAVRNPYFGEKMMTCGLTTDTITKDYKSKAMESPTVANTPGHNH